MESLRIVLLTRTMLSHSGVELSCAPPDGDPAPTKKRRHYRRFDPGYCTLFS